jgi:hypothetical protein
VLGSNQRPAAEGGPTRLPPGSWSFVTDPPGSGTATATFRFFGDGEGIGGATFRVTDADGLVADRFLTIQVCADPDVLICPLL